MTGQYRILETGSRHWADEAAIRTALARIIAPIGPQNVTVIHGACPADEDGHGADHLTDLICQAWTGITIERHPADWDHCGPGCAPNGYHRIPRKPGDLFHPGELDTYCPDAGPRRNRHMAALGANVCLAFPLPGSRGTRSTIRLAHLAGITVRTWPW